MLAYCSFGWFDRAHPLRSTAPVVDGQRWAGFDILVWFNDGWFMSAMFAVAGLFVRAGLRRHGRWGYLRRRLRRLGLPFAAAVLVIMPAAYYPSFLLAGAADGFWHDWWRTLTVGPWLVGPAWFLVVLLAWDAVASLLVAPDGDVWPAGAALAVAASLALAGTLALSWVFGSAVWLAAGPLAVQASRIGLYAAAFGLGVAVGPAVPAISVLFWAVVTTLAFAALLPATLAGWTTAHTGRVLAYAGALVTFCTSAAMLACGLAQAWFRPAPRWLRWLGRDAFGIYVLHYLPVLWLQYALLDLSWPGPLKAAVVLVLGLTASWAAAAFVRLAWRYAVRPSTSAML